MQSVAVAMMTIAEAAFLFSLNANFHITFVFRFYLSSFICAFVSFLLRLFLFKFKCRQLHWMQKKVALSVFAKEFHLNRFHLG